jgi:SRSO17 transposase
VGVTRQYCGQLGKQDTRGVAGSPRPAWCQAAVSLSVANEAASLRIAYRLYLPQDWALDPARRAKAGVPEDIAFETRPALALEQIEAALAAEVPRGVVLADAGGACPRAGLRPDAWGADMKFQARLLELELPFVVGVQPGAKVWPAGRAPLPPKAWCGPRPATDQPAPRCRSPAAGDQAACP